jgi:hypothetical protein
LVAIVALTACKPEPTPPPPPGPTAGLGENGEVNGLRFRPLDLVEDSRCPARVQCVWAGRVVVTTGVGKPGGGEEMRLDLTLGEPRAVYGGMMTLVTVDPPRGTIGSLEREAYRFTYSYTR